MFSSFFHCSYKVRKDGLSLFRLLWGLWALRDEGCLSLGVLYKISLGNVCEKWCQMAPACPQVLILVLDMCEDMLPKYVYEHIRLPVPEGLLILLLCACLSFQENQSSILGGPQSSPVAPSETWLRASTLDVHSARKLLRTRRRSPYIPLSAAQRLYRVLCSAKLGSGKA